MNRVIKVSVAAIALAAAVPSFAQENEMKESAAYGWTPVAFGLASPVQLPWGHCKWDVFGLNVGLLYSGECNMYGLGVSGLAGLTSEETRGVAVSGIFNYSKGDVKALRVTAGANICREGTVYGADIGLFGYRNDIWGLDIEGLGSYQDDVWGVQIAGIGNWVKHQVWGWQVAVGANITDIAYGWQLAGLFNMADELHGCQLGLVNYAKDCRWGFQIGLVNIILSNVVPVLPIVNAYF